VPFTQRERSEQSGPLVSSQDAPSAAAAMHVPVLAVGAERWQKPSAAQPMCVPSMSPQGCPAATAEVT
jgi:hypothetical protein